MEDEHDFEYITHSSSATAWDAWHADYRLALIQSKCCDSAQDHNTYHSSCPLPHAPTSRSLVFSQILICNQFIVLGSHHHPLGQGYACTYLMPGKPLLTTQPMHHVCMTLTRTLLCSCLNHESTGVAMYYLSEAVQWRKQGVLVRYIVGISTPLGLCVSLIVATKKGAAQSCGVVRNGTAPLRAFKINPVSVSLFLKTLTSVLPMKRMTVYVDPSSTQTATSCSAGILTTTSANNQFLKLECKIVYPVLCRCQVCHAETTKAGHV